MKYFLVFIRFLKKKILYQLPELIYVNYFLELNEKNLNPSSDELFNSLNSFINTLNSLNIKHSISKGTLLGYKRNKNLIKGDIDIDIDIFSNQMIFEILNLVDMTVYRTMIYKGVYQNIVFFDKRNNCLIDLAIFNFDRDKYINVTPHGTFSLPKKLVFGINNKNGYYTYNEEYLNNWYGKDWENPRPYFKSWIEHYKEDCKYFNFSNFVIKKVNFIKK